MKEKIDKIVSFIKTYVENTGKKSVVLGLSGGIESAVVAVLAKKALGSKNVHCFYLPEEEKENDFDKEHINKLCERFDLAYQTIPIGSIVNSIILANRFQNKTKFNKLTIANIKARVRMMQLYAYTNDHDALVIGTGNKSEIMIGYFTKYGDGGVDFEPIGYLYKTEVFKIAKELDIPNEIVDKPPTAGLWEGQTDEGEIGMSYEELDEILYTIENNLINEDYLKEKNIDYKNILKVLKMMEKNEHKITLPPILNDE